MERGVQGGAAAGGFSYNRCSVINKSGPTVQFNYVETATVRGNTSAVTGHKSHAFYFRHSGRKPDLSISSWPCFQALENPACAREIGQSQVTSEKGPLCNPFSMQTCGSIKLRRDDTRGSGAGFCRISAEQDGNKKKISPDKPGSQSRCRFGMILCRLQCEGVRRETSTGY